MADFPKLRGRRCVVRWLLGSVCGLVAAAAALGATPPTGGQLRDFEFQRLNRSYRDVPVAVEPVEAAPLHIVLTSPRHDLLLLRHRLRLHRLADGSHDAELWASFQGTGHLIADVSALGFGTRLRDDVTLPRQEKLLRARIRLARSAEGYLVTTVTLPRNAEVQLQSRLGGDVVRWCDQISFSLLSCEGLARALSSATVPLPAPGTTYLLANTELTTEEKTGLDRYLSGK